MNRLLFASKNVYDKLLKIAAHPSLLAFYLKRYVFDNSSGYDPETYIISYPKSGSTWVRLALQHYLNLACSMDRSVHEGYFVRLPEKRLVKIDNDMGDWVPAPPRIDQLRLKQHKFKGKKVCFIARHPGDILVSSWYHLKYRERIYSGDLSSFIRDDLVGVEKVIAFMNLWIEGHDALIPDFKLLLYEDLRREPEVNFASLFSFLGLNPDTALIKKTIEATSFEKMKKMESGNTVKEPWMQKGADKSDRSMKVRKGKVGGFKDELPDADIRFLTERITASLTQKLPYCREESYT